MTVNVTNTVGANNTIVLDGSSKIPAFDGSQVTALSGSAFTTGTLATARIDVGTGANQILQLDANAKLPALSATNLTNVPGPTVSTSDPAIDTNSTLGAKWVNKTSGEVYICTDATTGANVWTNVGAGSGDITNWFYQGTQYGYTAGGSSRTTTIDRFSFTTDGDAADWSDCSAARDYTAGQSSGTHGYIVGGSSNYYIEKYPFATQTNGTNIGTLSVNTARESPAGTGSETYGYTAGGGPATNIIDKFSFSTDGNATDVGNTLANVHQLGSAGCSSQTHGYIVGGHPGSTPYLNVIQRWPFASDTDSADVGDLLHYMKGATCQNSETHGYKAGGSSASGTYPTTSYGIQKWSFASGTQNAVDVGDTIVGRWLNAAHSSTTHGYQSAGSAGGNGNSIEKFPFASDSNATDVGNLTVSGSYVSGSHY